MILCVEKLSSRARRKHTLAVASDTTATSPLSNTTQKKPDRQSERLLTQICKRISQEHDVVRLAYLFSISFFSHHL